MCGVGFCQSLEGLGGAREQEAQVQEVTGAQCRVKESLEQCLLGYRLCDPSVLWPGILARKHHNASPWVESPGLHTMCVPLVIMYANKGKQ